MKQSFCTLTLLGAVLASAIVAGCQGGGGAAVDDSPEGRAFIYRQAVMRTIQGKMTQLRAMEQGEVPMNEAEFRESANELASLSTMLPEGFIANSAVAGSAALPEVWTNRADFDQKAVDFQDAARTFAETANTEGAAAAQEQVQTVAQTCGACHRPYRRRAADEE